MFVLACEIKIGEYIFNQIHNLKIIKSVDLISDTATIEIPTKFVLKSNNGKVVKNTAKTIKPGDEVSITLEYENVLKKIEFKGYVSRIKPNIPIEIECEDKVYLLRKKSIEKLYHKISLKEVLQDIVEGTEIELSGEIPDMSFEKLLIKNINGVQALQKLKEEYGVSAYLDDDEKLYVGLQQTEPPSQKEGFVNVKYEFGENIISQNLEWKTADDTKLQLKMISILKDNTKIEVQVGEPDGEQRTEFIKGITDKKELEQIGKERLKGLKYDGYKGTLTSFYYPFATRGMKAIIVDKENKQKEGSYFIPKIEIEFGINGGRRVVSLGNKL